LRIHEDRKPPTVRQRRFIDSLLESTSISAEEAATMVHLDSLDHLTGGSDGTASALIERLQAINNRIQTEK
jgi:hypothetical protein